MLNKFFFPNGAVHEIVLKNSVVHVRTQLRIWHMHIVCWLTKTTCTCICIRMRARTHTATTTTLGFSTAIVFSQTPMGVILYVH